VRGDHVVGLTRTMARCGPCQTSNRHRALTYANGSVLVRAMTRGVTIDKYRDEPRAFVPLFRGVCSTLLITVTLGLCVIVTFGRLLMFL
jgi:hypothetical protein